MKVKFTYSSTLECLDCSKVIQVGTAGFKNLDTHCASKACHQACCERTKASTKGAMLKKPPKPNQVLDAFFKPQVPLNPSMVSAPLPIRPDEVSIAAPECHAPGHKPGRMESHAHGARHILEDIPTETSAEKQTLGIRICQKAVSLLQSLEGVVS